MGCWLFTNFVLNAETEEGSGTSDKTFENLDEDLDETNPFFFEENVEMEEGSTKSDQTLENPDEGQDEINPFFFEGKCFHHKGYNLHNQQGLLLLEPSLQKILWVLNQHWLHGKKYYWLIPFRFFDWNNLYIPFNCNFQSPTVYGSSLSCILS